MDGVMNVTLGQPVMTREEFFPWAEAQDERYEFDGFAPVAMTGGTIGHSDISGNTRTALALRSVPMPASPRSVIRSATRTRSSPVRPRPVAIGSSPVSSSFSRC
jgi:hypothetical protein